MNPSHEDEEIVRFMAWLSSEYGALEVADLPETWLLLDEWRRTTAAPPVPGGKVEP